MKDIIKTKRDFPAVEKLAAEKNIDSFQKHIPRPFIVEIVRSELARIKKEWQPDKDKLTYGDLILIVAGKLQKAVRKKIGRVINAAGILVHTNLGRAPLSADLFDNIVRQVTGYGNLEFDVATGKRGKRGELAEKYLSLASGSEAGAIVNNNAAALFIILNSLANRRKILISRGELVQIGGGFRIPDIIRRSGAKMIEVGTTNITSVADYEQGLEENPALILKVHRSNFDQTGFTDDADLKKLVKLGYKHNIPVVNDLGSGVLIDTYPFTGQKEPTVQSSVRAGTALTCFSGDKLLGGMQGGLIVGTKELVTKIKKNPIYRVVRVDKTTFSTVEELLGYYLNNEWQDKIKLWRMAGRSRQELTGLGKAIIKESGLKDNLKLIESEAEMGGGSLPGVKLPSVALIVQSGYSPDKLAGVFRSASIPVIGRITDNKYMLDLKAVDQGDADMLVKTLQEIKDLI